MCASFLIKFEKFLGKFLTEYKLVLVSFGLHIISLIGTSEFEVESYSKLIFCYFLFKIDKLNL